MTSPMPLRRRLLTGLALALLRFAATAADLRTVSATYLYHAAPEMSVEQARQTALDRAMAQALANEFGVTVTQATASAMATGSDADTRSQFIAAGGSELRGEWIETIGEPEFDISFENSLLAVRCTVKGRARAINASAPRFNATPQRTDAMVATDFKDGDLLYLGFETPAAGHIAAYLTSPLTGEAYRLLPYSRMANTPLPVKAAVPYTFFKRDSADSRSEIDEVELTCSDLLELNDLYIIYAPGEYDLPAVDNPAEPDAVRSLPLKDFLKWLARSRTRNSAMQSQTFHLTIKAPQK